MIETFREFTFEAAHRTEPFEGLHGHSFKARVYLTGEADSRYGWSHNFYELDDVFTEVKKLVDHRYLNDLEGLSVATLENLARWIWSRFNERMIGLDRVVLSRGLPGQMEGCVCRGLT